MNRIVLAFLAFLSCAALSAQSTCEVPGLYEPPPCGSQIEYNGYYYETVEIGEQCWFAENLRTAAFLNGDSIPPKHDLISECEGDNFSPFQTVYGAYVAEGATSGEEGYCMGTPSQNVCNPDWSLSNFGRMYNWHAVVDSRGLCPSGWHVPSDVEWMTLEMELGMSEADANSEYHRGTDQGEQLKSAENPTWLSSLWSGTNSSGLNFLPAGNGGCYGYIWAGTGVTNSTNTIQTKIWTSTEYYIPSSPPLAFCRILRGTIGTIMRVNNEALAYNYVRCVKD